MPVLKLLLEGPWEQGEENRSGKAVSLFESQTQGLQNPLWL